MSIGPLDITDPLSGLQVIMLTKSVTRTLIMAIFLPTLFTLVFGRVFCSWLCPQNLFSELIDILSRKLVKSRLLTLPSTPVPRWIALIMILIGSLLVGFPLGSLLSAPGIISIQISMAVLESTIGLEIMLIVFILAGEFFILRRFWCRYICGVGTLLGFFRFTKTLKIVFQKDSAHPCINCGACTEACQFDLNPKKGNLYPQCHNCGDCIAACTRSTGNRNPLRFNSQFFYIKTGKKISQPHA